MRPASHVYDVQILYREPVYETWTGGEQRLPFVARYDAIEASSRREAVEIAENRFHDQARNSRVKWRREVVEIRVQPLN